MAELAQEQLQNVAQAVQGVNQAVQEMKSSLQAAGMLSKDQSGGKTTLGVEDITHDIGADEAYTAAVVSNTRVWNWNEKALAELELSKKQHDFAIQQQLDQVKIARENLALREAEDHALVKHLVNLEYTKFNAAVSEPIAPNTGAVARKQS